VLALAVCADAAVAATQVVNYGNLTAAATVQTPLNPTDTLFLNTFTTERGALSETTTFTVGPGVGSFVGRAAWEVGGANEPNLSGVNIDIFNSSNALVASDTFAGLLAGFAHSTFGPGAPIGPGTYTLVATGTGNRDTSLDISLTLAPIPEPTAIAMMIAGLLAVGALSQRKRS